MYFILRRRCAIRNRYSHGANEHLSRLSINNAVIVSESEFERGTHGGDVISILVRGVTQPVNSEHDTRGGGYQWRRETRRWWEMIRKGWKTKIDK